MESNVELNMEANVKANVGLKMNRKIKPAPAHYEQKEIS